MVKNHGPHTTKLHYVVSVYTTPEISQMLVIPCDGLKEVYKSVITFGPSIPVTGLALVC
jgi:hypothetical protein